MQKISSALDSVWVTGAFDPRKPFDPDWASKPPKPVLRSGDEDEIFYDSPYEHHQGTDAMQADPEGAGAVEPTDDDELYAPGVLEDPRDSERLSGISPDELLSIGEHAGRVKLNGGRLEGSQGHYVEYHPTSSVNHYYTYNPRREGDPEPWNLVSTHWALNDEVPQSRHTTFNDAVRRGTSNRAAIDRLVG